MRAYAPLTLSPIKPGSRVASPNPPGRVTLDDPAFSVMTDLREVSAATTTPEEPIDAAHAVMIRRGVRLLFVLDEQAALAGIITASDLLGVKPMRFMQSHGVAHAEVQVRDIIATLKAVRRQHLTVAEDGGTRVRGLFSASQVARQLGMELQTFEVAQTFAAIEAALAR